MAAAIIPVVLPILEDALPILKPYILSLVTHVEHLFGAKTGPTKFDQVLSALLTAASQMSSAGTLQGQLGTPQATSMIQQVVDELKGSNQLTPSNATAAVQAGMTLPLITTTLTITGRVSIG